MTKLQNCITNFINETDSSQHILFKYKIGKLNEELHEIFNDMFRRYGEKKCIHFC